MILEVLFGNETERPFVLERDIVYILYLERPKKYYFGTINGEKTKFPRTWNNVFKNVSMKIVSK